MKNTFKSALAVLTFGLALAACTPKEKAADTTVETDSVTVTAVDSSAVQSDTTAVDTVSVQ